MNYDYESKTISGAKLFEKNEMLEWIEKKNEIYQIKKEINNFGISDKQRYFLIFLLASELENVQNSREISELILTFRPDLNVSNQEE